MKLPSVLLLILLAVLPGSTRAADAPKPVRVFLFAGQSNMEGADAHPDRIDAYPDYRGAGAPQPDVLFVTLPREGADPRAVWRPLAPRDSFGPEITFTRKVSPRVDSPIAIIKSSIGGTTVAFDWNPDAPETGQKLYPRTLALVRESLDELKKRGFQPRLEALVWHQGENDMLDRRLNTNYAAGLTRMLARLRQDLQVPNLPGFIGEVSEKGIWGMDHRGHLGILRRQQDQVLKADPLLHWVPTSHLAFEVMGSGQPHYHFGTQGQLQLGEAFADAYLDSIGRRTPVPSRAYPGKLPFAKGTRVRVFVMAGQRNMEGEDSFVSQIGQMPGFEALAQPQSSVPFRFSLGGGIRSSTTWEPLSPVRLLGNFGPELSFGAHLRKHLGADEAIAIVKFTHSGAQSPDWSPAGTAEEHRNLYPRFSGFVRTALEDLRKQGHEPTLAGVFWHMGENDTFFDPYLRKQADSMRTLITRVREDFKEPALPWFLSEQHPASPWKNIDVMNQAIGNLTQSTDFVYRVPTAHLPHERLHFGTRGTLLLGEALAQAYLDRK